MNYEIHIALCASAMDELEWHTCRCSLYNANGQLLANLIAPFHKFKEVYDPSSQLFSFNLTVERDFTHRPFVLSRGSVGDKTIELSLTLDSQSSLRLIK